MERLKMYFPKIDGTKIKLHYYRPHQEIPENDSMVIEKIVGHRVRNGDTNGVYGGKATMKALTVGNQLLAL